MPVMQTPATPDGSPSNVPTAPLPLGENAQPSERIGPYKLLQKIGEGGYGIVYMAEQAEPMRRHVALKVIKLGMDTKQVIARFEAERQALALMDHPNIAKVLDAGATETGRPYFVMELVRGVRITEYCDDNNLSPRQRLELFIPVCQAIQHAHQKGIIHRDIKPSNVLVTSNDGVPLPKVIDFGIAKATAQPLTDKTLFTAFDQFIGTPAYMSPEQAGLNLLDIDTRSDIYSLGVLLYELLTGKTPFEPKELLAAGMEEMRRILREKDPPRPSTRLSTLNNDERTTVARRRHSDSPRLIHLMRGDLDWIVMKCLEKDRTRRYETASGLALEIQRYLSDEPVAARPPGKVYRLQKLARRNKLAFAAGGAVAATLMLGLGLSTWLWLRERDDRRRAVAAEQKALTEAGKKGQVAKFLKDMLEGAGPSVALGRDTTLLREIVAKAADRVGQDLRDQAEVQAELQVTLGGIYCDLGKYDEAVPLLRQALTTRQRLFGNESPQAADSLEALAGAVWGQDKLQEAEALYRQAVAIEEKAASHEGPEATSVLANLAGVLRQEGKLAEAESLYRQALARLRGPTDKETPEVASTLSSLATVLWSQAKLPEAESIQRQALAMRRKLLGDEHPDVSISLNNLSAILRDARKLPEAEDVCRQALAMKRKMLGNDHPDVAISLQNLASVLREEGKSAEAEPVLRECLALREKVIPDDWRTPSTRSTLGGCLLLEKKYTEAEPLLLSGYDGLAKAQERIPPSSKARFREAAERLVQLYEATDRPEQAAQWKQKLAGPR
jgi:eukaryotic-like serine/threonine-protein kinase